MTFTCVWGRSTSASRFRERALCPQTHVLLPPARPGAPEGAQGPGPSRPHGLRPRPAAAVVLTPSTYGDSREAKCGVFLLWGKGCRTENPVSEMCVFSDSERHPAKPETLTV